jgi:hypothetical protein
MTTERRPAAPLTLIRVAQDLISCDDLTRVDFGADYELVQAAEVN